MTNLQEQEIYQAAAKCGGDRWEGGYVAFLTSGVKLHVRTGEWVDLHGQPTNNHMLIRAKMIVHYKRIQTGKQPIQRIHFA